MFFRRLISILKERNSPFAIAGGHAVSLHGAVRSTLDIDIVVNHSRESFKLVADSLEELGLRCILPVTPEQVFEFRKEYVEQRDMHAWRFINNARPSEIVDILIQYDLRNLKTTEITVFDQWIKVVAIKDLIRMKDGTGRQQDISDVEALRKLM